MQSSITINKIQTVSINSNSKITCTQGHQIERTSKSFPSNNLHFSKLKTWLKGENNMQHNMNVQQYFKLNADCDLKVLSCTFVVSIVILYFECHIPWHCNFIIVVYLPLFFSFFFFFCFFFSAFYNYLHSIPFHSSIGLKYWSFFSKLCAAFYRGHCCNLHIFVE